VINLAEVFMEVQRGPPNRLRDAQQVMLSWILKGASREGHPDRWNTMCHLRGCDWEQLLSTYGWSFWEVLGRGKQWDLEIVRGWFAVHLESNAS
jgi:hypothetical protein